MERRELWKTSEKSVSFLWVSTPGGTFSGPVFAQKNKFQEYLNPWLISRALRKENRWPVCPFSILKKIIPFIGYVKSGLKFVT